MNTPADLGARNGRGALLAASSIFAAFVILISCQSRPTAPVLHAASVDPTTALTSLIKSAESERIRAAEVLCIPQYIENIVNFTPNTLQRDYRFKISVPQFEESRLAPSLLAALKETTLIKATYSGDVRWGVSLSLVSGQVSQIYMDGFGRLGQIDGIPVSFQASALHKWFQQFSVCEK